MAYTRTNWSTGDTITATKLNNMESAIEANGSIAGIMVITLSNNVMNKTFTEIFNHLSNGGIAFVKDVSTDAITSYVTQRGMYPVIKAYKYSDNYRVYAIDASSFGNKGSTYYYGMPKVVSYTAATATSYPSYLGEVTLSSTGRDVT